VLVPGRRPAGSGTERRAGRFSKSAARSVPLRTTACGCFSDVPGPRRTLQAWRVPSSFPPMGGTEVQNLTSTVSLVLGLCVERLTPLRARGRGGVSDQVGWRPPRRRIVDDTRWPATARAPLYRSESMQQQRVAAFPGYCQYSSATAAWPSRCPPGVQGFSAHACRGQPPWRRDRAPMPGQPASDWHAPQPTLQGPRR
jgi:hypothetical protein